MQESIRKSQQIVEDLGVGRIGFTRVGHGLIGSDGDDSIFHELMLILFPETKGVQPSSNKVFDIMNIETHILYSRDFFVTSDNDYIRCRDTLLSLHRIKIMTPQECAIHLQSDLNV